MAGATPYGGGAGGKLRKKAIKRSATPYDRPLIAVANNNPNFLKRILYAGADKLFGVFRKRIPVPRIKETNEEQRNGLHDAGPNSGSKTFTEVSEPTTNEARNLANISAGTEISELEKMLKQKTFTRSEIERLTALLHSKTTESDVREGDKVRISNTSQHMQHEASTSGPSNKYVEDRENFHAVISTPVVNSRAFEEDVASPAELAKAYMGTRPAKVSPTTLKFGSQAPRQDSVLLHNTTILPRTPITSFAPKTAGSLKGFENGLTTPRSRGRSAMYNMARSPYYRGPSTLSQKASSSLVSSQPAWEHEGSIGTTMAGKRRSSALDDIGSGGPMRRIRQKANIYSQGSSLSKNRSEIGSSAQRLVLRNEPEPKDSKAVEENGETSKHNISYPSVPSESTKMASKIFEHLERMSPKEKPSRSMLDGTTEKPATKFTLNQTLGSSDKMESPKFLLSQNNQAHESTSQSKNKVEENGPKKFAVPLDVLSSLNGNSTMPARGNASITNTDSTLKLPAEPPQKKRAFQMSANKDSQEIENDNHSYGHASPPLSENLKTGIFVSANKVVSADAISPPKSGFGPASGSFVNKQKVGYNFQTSPPSSSNTQSAGLSQSTSSLPKEPTVFPTFGNKPLGVKQNTSPDAKPLGSTSLFSSDLKNKQVQVLAFNKDDNGNAQKSAFVFEKYSFSASPTTASASGISSFGDSIKNSSITNGATSAPSSVFPTFTQAPISSFGYPTASSTTALAGPTSEKEAPLTSAIKDKEPKSNNTSSSLFAGTSFSSSAATSTTNGHSQGTAFGFQANTQASVAATHANPFKIESSPTGIPSSTSGSSLLGSSAPSFGLGTTFASSEIKSGSSASSSTSNMFGTGFVTTPSFGLGSAASSSPFSFGTSSASTPSINAGASTGSSLFSFTAASATNSFVASSPVQSVFGNPTPVFNAATASPNINDQMSMEDNMAEDSTHTPSPAGPAFVQPTQGFMFGSGTPTTPSAVPLFSGQINQQPVQNPFQASGSLEFSAGGSFSVGKSEGDKSSRRQRPFKARRQIKK